MQIPQPTKDDFDRLFHDITSDEGQKDITEKVSSIYREAKKSDRATAASVGLVPLIMSAVTAGGVSSAPILKVMLYGFVLGLKYCESCTTDPALPSDFSEYLKNLDIEIPPSE